MKLAFVCPNLATGGAERQWVTLVSALQDRGAQVTVVTLDGRGRFFEELTQAGVSVVFAGLRSRRDARGIVRALAAIKGHDVVVTRGPSAQVVGTLAGMLFGITHCTTEHTPVDAAGRMRPWRSDQQRLIRTFAARADAVIAVADAQRDALVAAGYRPNRIRIIANAVDAAKFVPGVERSRVRDALGLRPDAVVFLLAASMRQEKRIPTFVNWIRQARCHEPSIVGVVAGRGSDSSEFRALVGDDGAVVGLGVREDVPDLLNAADVAVLTSSAEALPMVLIEAAITGLPLLATDVGDANTIVRNGETGFLVGADDCKAFVAQALALASDASLREKLGNAAQARACVLFNVPRMVGAYHDIFAELIAARR